MEGNEENLWPNIYKYVPFLKKKKIASCDSIFNYNRSDGSTIWWHFSSFSNSLERIEKWDYYKSDYLIKDRIGTAQEYLNKAEAIIKVYREKTKKSLGEEIILKELTNKLVKLKEKIEIEIEKGNKKIKKNADNALKWLATEFNYVKELKKDLEDLKIHCEKKNIKKMESAINQIGRSERRLNRYIGKLEKKLKGLGQIVPPHLGEPVSDFEKHMDVTRLRALEYYAYGGRFYRFQRNIIKTYRSFAKKNPEIMQEVISKSIGGFIKEIDDSIKWLDGLIVLVKKLKEYVESNKL